MISTFFLGAFFGFFCAHVVRVVIATIGLYTIQRKGFCARCGRKAPAVIGYTVYLETGDRYSAVFCEPCYRHQVHVIQETPPPWS